MFTSLWHRRVVLAAWQRDYNEVWPHSALGGRGPGSMWVPPCPPGSRPLRAAARLGVAGTKKRCSTELRNIGAVGMGMNQGSISSQGRGVGARFKICKGKEI